MPNPDPPPFATKLNLYNFAGRIVGKCLYESSQGQVYRQCVPARLAKSFLAQLVIHFQVLFQYLSEIFNEVHSSIFACLSRVSTL